MESQNDLMNKVVSLCKRRGFIFQSSEIYGGLKSCYDYGPLGVELKRNIAHEWWNAMVYQRDDIVGLDASILMHSDVWKASGHLANFSDPLVDCLNCKERFRADKAPKKDPGSVVEYKSQATKKMLTGEVSPAGYVCPQCNAPTLSGERDFRGMFRTTMGAVDPLGEFVEQVYGKDLSKDEFNTKLREYAEKSAVYLRPETAQAIFVQFLNIAQSQSMKVPFGVAQQGKSFRNEIIVEHFIFRSCEFEQMEMEFFCEPGTQATWMDYWKNERINWYRRFANQKDNFRLRAHREDELAHYADQCFDVEYRYPWGWDELEGIASRTDYDLKKHAEASGTKLSYFDQNKTDPATGKQGWRYTPYVIEPAAGLTRTVLCMLLDAYCEEKSVDAAGNEKSRMVLKLHPRLAPYKVAVLPLLKKEELSSVGRDIVQALRSEKINVAFDDAQSIGKRYAKHDEIGTPFCLTIDQESLSDNMVTLRERDSTQQRRIPISAIIDEIKTALK